MNERPKPSVYFVWADSIKKWIIKGDHELLCKHVDVETQTCQNKGHETCGHTCLTPAPEVCPYWETRCEFYGKADLINRKGVKCEKCPVQEQCFFETRERILKEAKSC